MFCENHREPQNLMLGWRFRMTWSHRSITGRAVPVSPEGPSQAQLKPIKHESIYICYVPKALLLLSHCGAESRWMEMINVLLNSNIRVNHSLGKTRLCEWMWTFCFKFKKAQVKTWFLSFLGFFQKFLKNLGKGSKHTSTFYH